MATLSCFERSSRKVLFPDAMFPSTAIISGRVVEVLVDRGEGKVLVLVEKEEGERAVMSQDQRLESSIVVAISTGYHRAAELDLSRF